VVAARVSALILCDHHGKTDGRPGPGHRDQGGGVVEQAGRHRDEPAVRSGGLDRIAAAGRGEQGGHRNREHPVGSLLGDGHLDRRLVESGRDGGPDRDRDIDDGGLTAAAARAARGAASSAGAA
jgi:hypothetical protein